MMTATTVPLEQVALVVHPDDNVAVAKTRIAANTTVTWNGQTILVRDDIPPGHRFALTDLPAGTPVKQYGQPFGTSLGITVGERITRERISNALPPRSVMPASKNAPPDYLPEAQVPTWHGFRRKDGNAGTRNYVLVVPTSMCASTEAFQIAMRAELLLWSPDEYPNVNGVSALPHNKGCGCPDGTPVEMLMKVLARYIEHPNVAAALVIQLGCEKTNFTAFAKYMEPLVDKKPVKFIGIQECGGTQATIRRGLDIVGELLELANQCQRVPVSASELILGVKCGGSDAFSGITANPALGYAADFLVRCRGTVILTEVPEIYGAEHVLAERARDEEVARQIVDAVKWFRRYVGTFGHDLDENPSLGNIEGGLINIAIKSLGAIVKAGTSRIEGVIGYADPPPGKGLYLMQGPGYDQESTPGLVAAGAQIVGFTTGRGTTIGNAIAPVVKIASNTPTFERMKGDIDLNAGTILDGVETIEQVGERIFAELLAVASGKPCKAELNGHREFQVWAVEGVSL
ncbi:Altronate dehydratase [bacterium HR17]|jgi:altronate hydrolase|uniref:Altronate dehydratase n=1 Tax=Candidatus Fervidibacter japonicus TaxID=2035412 RepID=A0A2H5XC68_9BACT|nr:Altronate dehydratase [bacterium HR17]